MNKGITCFAAPRDVLIRSVPEGVSRRLPASSMAPRIAAIAGPMLPTNCAPASDNETLRVVRLNKRTPIFVSNA